MDPITVIDGAVSVLDRDDVDTDQIIPKQFLKRVERTGFGEFLFYDWAKEPGLGPAAEPDPRDRPQLRLRLVARARAVGARGLRLQGDRRAVVRRHLLRRTAPRSGCCRSRSPADDVEAVMAAGERAGRPRRPGGARGTAARRASTSTPTSSTACSTASTRSALTLQKEDAIAAYEAERERSGPVTTAL